jgi:hypothetical protein
MNKRKGVDGWLARTHAAAVAAAAGLADRASRPESRSPDVAALPLPEEDRMSDTQSDKQSETVGGYVVPVDPMDEFGCESCQ